MRANKVIPNKLALRVCPSAVGSAAFSSRCNVCPLTSEQQARRLPRLGCGVLYLDKRRIFNSTPGICSNDAPGRVCRAVTYGCELPVRACCAVLRPSGSGLPRPSRKGILSCQFRPIIYECYLPFFSRLLGKASRACQLCDVVQGYLASPLGP